MDWLKARWLQPEKLDKLRKLMQFADQLGVSMPALAVAWTIKNPNVSTAILGASREEQLTENLKALDVLPMLTPEVMEEIEKILQNKPTMDLS